MLTTRRIELGDILHEICPRVYWQAPPNTGMKYPCILYQREGNSIKHADNTIYRYSDRFAVTYISKTTDDDVLYQINSIPQTSYNRDYIKDNLYHTVFTIYY